MRLLPHEVADVQPVLDLLYRQDLKDSEVRHHLSEHKNEPFHILYTFEYLHLFICYVLLA